MTHNLNQNRSLNNKMKKLCTILGLAAITSLTAVNAQTVAQWNFNSLPPDASNSTGNATASIGTGTPLLLGGVTNPGFNSGVGSSDPAALDNTGYQTETYAAQSVQSGQRGVRFNASTIGFNAPSLTGLNISFDLRTSNTSSRWYQLDYTTNGGTSWTLGTPTRLGSAPSAGDTWHNESTVFINNVAVLDNADFGFRIVSVFSPVAFTQVNGNVSYGANTAYEVARNPATGTNSAYAGGTWRFDMVTVTAIPEPTTFLLIGLGSSFLLLNSRRRRDSLG